MGGDPVEPPTSVVRVPAHGHTATYHARLPGMASLGALTTVPVVTVPGPQPPSPACLCVEGQESHRASMLRILEVRAAPALSPRHSHRLL